MGRLRDLGVACDTDYAGRSLKGQLTQATRLGAGVTVIVRQADASLRRAGEEDVTLPHDSVLGSLSP
jgi:histidyl-tRNA synthetase